MQKKTLLAHDLISWIALIFLCFSSIILSVVLILYVPNPVPIIVLLVEYGIFAYIFRFHKIKLLTLFLFLIVTIWIMIGIVDTSAVSLKCSPELRKNPGDRDMKVAEIEAKNFDSCLNSITFLDNIWYGLLKD